MALGYGRTGTNNFAVSKFIVDAAGLSAGATHTTIASALASASSDDTIFIKHGTYTENLTISKNISLVSVGCETRGSSINLNPVIFGKLTFTGNFAVTMNGIHHGTDGSNLVDDGGNAISITYNDCRIGIRTAVVAFNLTGTNGNVYVNYSFVTGFTGAQLFTSSNTYNLWFNYSWFETWDTASTAASVSVVRYSYCNDPPPLSLSSGASLIANFSKFGVNKAPFTNLNFLTTAGTGYSVIRNCYISSGTAVAISIGSGTTVECTSTELQSSNSTAVIDGAGTLVYSNLSFVGTKAITTTTQTIAYEGPSKTMGSPNIGATNTLTVTNDDNTNTASHSNISSVVGGTSGGDPYSSWSISGSTAYSMGIDNSDSDSLKLNSGSTGPSAGTNLLKITTAGELTMPLQPAFLAYLASTATNKTGNGAVYTLGTDALTEVYDQGGDFNTNGTFTAPVTGRYKFDSVISFTGVTVATNFTQKLVATSRTFQNKWTRAASNSGASTCISVEVDMTAGDTATTTIQITGEAADTDDIEGSGANTFFSGYLIC